jgi:hypothetical protein
MLPGQAPLPPQSHVTGIPSDPLGRERQRLPRAGLVDLLAPRTLPHTRSTSSLDVRLPLPGQPQLVRLTLAPPCTARARARIDQTCDALARDPRGRRRGLALHPLSPAVVPRHAQRTQPASLPPVPARQQRALGFEPTPHACCRPWSPTSSSSGAGRTAHSPRQRKPAGA